MIIFFASMAYQSPEHTSQAVSRPLRFPLTPLEKYATLPKPLEQNTTQSARNFTGADSVSPAGGSMGLGNPLASVAVILKGRDICLDFDASAIHCFLSHLYSCQVFEQILRDHTLCIVCSSSPARR
jgi:hypothetical protein